MKLLLLLLTSVLSINGIAQTTIYIPDSLPARYDKEYADVSIADKKPLTHDVYDSWQNLGERVISPSGLVVAFVVNPQEGDGYAFVSNAEGKLVAKFARGYNLSFSNSGEYLVGRIKAPFKETREAKIKKKKAEDMPKDSMFLYEIATGKTTKWARVKGYKMPEKEGEWLAYQLEKSLPEKPAKTVVAPDSITQINSMIRTADSLRKVADSLVQKTKEAQKEGLAVLLPPKKESKPAVAPKADEPIEEGTDLVLRNLKSGEERTFKLVNEYYFDKYGKKLLIETSKKNSDSLVKARILWHDLTTAKTDTAFEAFNDAKNYAISEDATQLAFVVEKDSAAKALQKFYRLYHYNGSGTAKVIAERGGKGIATGKTISPDFNNSFSKDGTKLFFGIAPIRKPKDTTLVDFETARLDIWTTNDDYLQPMQQVQLQQELRRSNLAVFHIADNKIIPLGNDTIENAQIVNEGNASYVLAQSTYGNRKEIQWDGFAKTSAYIIRVDNGMISPIFKNKRANATASPMGKYITWYDWDKRCWMSYNVATSAIKNITEKIKTPMYDEDDDHPDAPPPHGLMRWAEDDKYVYLYDKYDIWQVDPTGTAAPKVMTKGRANKVIVRWVNTDADDRFLKNGKKYMYTYFSETTKMSDIHVCDINAISVIENPGVSSTFRGFVRAKNEPSRFAYTCENPSNSPYILSYQDAPEKGVPFDVKILYSPNPQQVLYNWYDTELIRWRMFDGRMSEGILYKPENFDPKKKYPIIFYFYERNSDDLYNYRGPAPSASTINIPYFVSNGYLVFDPNIYYKNGEPGESAYNSVVSAAKYLTQKYKWIDSTKMAIQGQSWGGYQVAYLITRTKIFAAAGAGAPVVNMTSAYGGIRWGSGMNRQFQYERGQSRLGATLWKNRELYLKNSPLFSLDKVTTPVLIMHNDKDGAVPWYQGIEMFTAMKRLNKKAWLLQYNDEDHNLVERRNRKDLSVRLGQFFDHYLKGKPMPIWMSKGVPATEKGIEWGLELGN